MSVKATTLQPVHESGWRSRFFNLIRKELQEAFKQLGEPARSPTLPPPPKEPPDVEEIVAVFKTTV